MVFSSNKSGLTWRSWSVQKYTSEVWWPWNGLDMAFYYVRWWSRFIDCLGWFESGFETSYPVINHGWLGNLWTKFGKIIEQNRIVHCHVFAFAKWDGTIMYPLVMTNIAIENGPVEIVGFPIKSGGSFQFAMLVYQRVKSLYSIIYGIILPIDSYFSRWLLHHQPDDVLWPHK